MTFQRRGFRLAAAIAWVATVPTGSACAPPAERPNSGEPAAASQPKQDWEKNRPRTDERKKERRRMVSRQIASQGIRDQAVLEAMRNVPRHWFVPGYVQASAYNDHPLPIGMNQTISQPYIVARMTEALKLTSDAKVLEVGTGSGYQAAVLAEITPHVYTIEIVEVLAEKSMQRFKRYGYDTIVAKAGDGYAGWPAHAPFDAIIVTCAPGHVPPELVKQLKPGGRLCIPVGPQGFGQSLQLITKQPDGSAVTKDLLPVRFVPMTGQAREKHGEGGPN